MNERARLIALVNEAVKRLGTNAEVARYVGRTPALITEYIKGRSTPPGDVVIKLQDLVKRAACVLIALAGLMQSPDGGAIGHASEHGPATSSDTVHIVQWWKSFLRWLSLPFPKLV